MSTRGYDQLAPIYKLIEFAVFGRTLERARFVHFSALSDRKRILLLGDGDGRGLALACKIAPQAHIESIDFSRGMLTCASRRLHPTDRSRVTLRQADALTAPLESEGYDAVVTLFFLDCFSNNQVSALLQRIRPLLTPDARWLHADFELPSTGWSRLRAHVLLPIMFWFFRWQTGLTTQKLPDSEKLFRATGFQRTAQTAQLGGFIVSSIFEPTLQPPS